MNLTRQEYKRAIRTLQTTGHQEVVDLLLQDDVQRRQLEIELTDALRRTTNQLGDQVVLTEFIARHLGLKP